jgi:hypothetical protein
MVQVEDKPWLLPLLRKFSRRPGAYLGGEDVRSLDLFLNAYSQAREDLGLPAFVPGEDTLFKDFESWLSQRSGLSDTRGWWGLIERLDTTSNNIRTFLHLFDEFLRTQCNEREGLQLGT